MKGLVIINAYPSGEKFLRQGERIALALNRLGIETDVLRNGEVYARIRDNGEVQTEISEKYGFAVYLDKDKYLGKMLEMNGMRLFNSAKAVETCDDKMLTYLALSEKGIALAESIPAPLCYTKNAKSNEKFLKRVAEKLGFPLVVKKSFGSFGVGVQLVHGMPELIKTAQEFLHEPHFYQRYIAQSTGQDVRVIVIGGKVITAMRRVAQGQEFRSNIELGGQGERIELPQAYANTAVQAANALGLDYCGVDLLFGENGPIVCEVNSNAFFEGIEQVTGVDVAEAYAKHIRQTLSEKNAF